jgi:hypothetical protein
VAGDRRRVGLRNAILIGVLAAAAGVVVLAARAAQNAQVDADMRELQAYRLSMPKIQQMNDAYLAFFKSLQSDPKFVALQKAREELRALEDKEELTAADERRIEQLEKQVEDAEDIVSPSSSDQQSLADIARAIESQPLFALAVKRAGLTAREFATIQLSLMQAMFAHGFKKAGAVKELPKDVPVENVKFVEEHEAELTAMAKQWQALGNGGAGSDDSDEHDDDEGEADDEAEEGDEGEPGDKL